MPRVGRSGVRDGIRAVSRMDDVRLCLAEEGYDRVVTIEAFQGLANATRPSETVTLQHGTTTSHLVSQDNSPRPELSDPTAPNHLLSTVIRPESRTAILRDDSFDRQADLIESAGVNLAPRSDDARRAFIGSEVDQGYCLGSS